MSVTDPVFLAVGLLVAAGLAHSGGQAGVAFLDARAEPGTQ